MKIGIPTEIKPLEGRVALLPNHAASLVKLGHYVFVQSGAGVESGFSDDEYQAAGVEIVENAAQLYQRARLIVKVKDPINADLKHLNNNHILFSFLHLASNQGLMNRLQNLGLTAIAFETVVDGMGRLPCLAPMSEIAGRLGVQIGATLLHKAAGGKGFLLGGVTGAESGNVMVLGCGSAGLAAISLAAAMGAKVTAFDIDTDKLEKVRQIGPNVSTFMASNENISTALKDSDLLIGAVLQPGRRAKKLVSAQMVEHMSGGSIIVDIAIDQGGCVETIHATDYIDPTYEKFGVIHFGVTNIPGIVPVTASQALSAAILPYVIELAESNGVGGDILRAAVNINEGKVVHPALI